MILLTAYSLQAQTRSQVSLVGPSQVRLGGEAHYSALLNDSPAAFPLWSVDGFAGGDASTGPISASGVYSPASTIWAGASVTISATTGPAASARLRIKVLNPLPVFSYGSVTQQGTGATFLLDVRGSGFVSASQLQASGADVATVFVSSAELQSTINLPAGTTSVDVGVLNPNAAQNSAASRTLPVQAVVSSPALSMSYFSRGHQVGRISLNGSWSYSASTP